MRPAKSDASTGQAQAPARREAKALLLSLVRGPLPVQSTGKAEGLDYWERDYLRKAVRYLRRVAHRSKTPLARTSELRMQAEELAMLRAEAAEMNPGRWNRDQSGFAGSRRHLDMLLESLGAPYEINRWNTWRARSSRVRPDLRGASLWKLDFTHVRLHRARLDRVSLGAATLRVADLRGVSLREANLSQADLSYATLRDADLRDASLDGTVLTEADLSGADLRGANLTGCVLNRARLYGAKLQGALVWGTSVWDAQFDDTTQQEGLLIGWSDLDPIDVAIDETRSWRLPEKSLVVDDLRVAHFMSLVRENESLAEVIDAASSKMVLLLGRFTGQQKQVLNALKDELPNHGYAPVVFDFREPVDRDLIETVATLAGLAKFIIADLSRPRSTPLESQLTIPQIAIPWVPIIRAGEHPFSMFLALQRKYDWVLPTVRYQSVPSLLRQLEERVIRPAEALSRRLKAMKHSRS